MLTVFSGAFIGLILICAGLALAAFRYYQAASSGNFLPPVVVSPGGAQKLIQTAMTGNLDAIMLAATEALHLHLNEGSLEQKLLSLGMADVQRQISDPNGQAPIIKSVAHFTGLTEQQVFDVFKAELLGVQPTPPAPVLPVVPVASAVATAVVLLMCSVATAASPLRAPERYYAEQPKIVIDSPVFYGPVSESQRNEILLPNHSYQQPVQPVSYVRYATGDSCGPTGCELCPNGYYQQYYYQGSYYQDSDVGFWQRGPVRRFLSNRQPLRRAGRFFTAPFRFLFRGRR